VLIVSEFGETTWSRATLAQPGKTPTIRRIGDTFGDYRVAFIGTNPRSTRPTVWLEDEGLCRAELFTSPERPGESHPRTRERGVLSKIKQLGETEFEVDRSVVEEVLRQPQELWRIAGKPEVQDGRVLGVRLYGVRPGTLLGALGVKNGDRIDSVNGFSVGDPQRALEAYARLRTAEDLTFEMLRDGRRMTLSVHIE
jgi:general secretion pathway protein C